MFHDRLADMDRRLGEMQAEFDREDPIDRLPLSAREPDVTSAPAVAPAPAGVQVGAGTAPSRRLLSAMRELLDGYEQMLAPPAAAPSPAAEPPVTISAGPFPDTGALKQFERALARLPGVRDVALRGYEGADRAIIEVQLS